MSAAPDTTTATVRPKVDLGALIIPAVVAAVGVFLVAGILGMRVAGDGGLFGPKAFPWIVAVLCFVVATLMTVEVLRPHPVTVTADPGDEADAILDLAPPEPEASNWRSLLIVAAGVLLFIALLQPLGWLIAGSLLFAVVGFGLGARSPLGLVLGGVGMTSAIQIVFSGFLGIHVPAGIFG